MSISINVLKGEITGVFRDDKALTRQHWDDGVVNGTVRNVQPVQLVRFELGDDGFAWWGHPRHCWFWKSPTDDESESFTIHFDDEGEIQSITVGEQTVSERQYDLNSTSLAGTLSVIRPVGLIKVEDSGSEKWGVYDRHGAVWI